MGDESWRALPKRMSRDTRRRVAHELGSLLRAQGRPFSIVLHGGEPLLLGGLQLDDFFSVLRAEVGTACGLSVQTNGVLIEKAILDVCAKHDVTLSVSLDGPAEIHDRFRVDLRRQPTHSKVIRGINRLKAHPRADRLFSGILAVIDPTFDPEIVYAYFKELGVPSVDFLYRDGNHSALPAGKASVESSEYGMWMMKIADMYISDPEPFRCRILDDLMRLLLGGAGSKEGVGLTDYGILVIDTDGTIKKNDTLKSTPLGDAFGGDWNISSVSLVSIATSAEFDTYHRSQKPSSAICQACTLLNICGGGMVTHRFKNGNGYDNPTVFCADQKILIAHVRDRLAPYIASRAA